MYGKPDRATGRENVMTSEDSPRLSAYKRRLLRGEPREQAWLDSFMNDNHPDDAVPMTKAETIMRREEAMKLHWPMIAVQVKYRTDVWVPGLGVVHWV